MLETEMRWYNYIIGQISSYWCCSLTNWTLAPNYISFFVFFWKLLVLRYFIVRKETVPKLRICRHFDYRRFQCIAYSYFENLQLSFRNFFYLIRFFRSLFLYLMESLIDITAWNYPNTELFLVYVNLRIQSEYRKIRTRNTSIFGHFSCSALYENWNELLCQFSILFKDLGD